ncbi:hypothetical protein GCM10010274_27540 [Streptomyces lavendofoliae]|uniref:Uncharacterized protein n=1 Tax=Streptomyces lavendofoliae TaxID=67314 RepID=A0A918M3Z4_9ACTN|nr:hypothetical protein GCM10010274_27540 [Streptomyces lavendofoliae]
MVGARWPGLWDGWPIAVGECGAGRRGRSTDVTDVLTRPVPPVPVVPAWRFSVVVRRWIGGDPSGVLRGGQARVRRGLFAAALGMASWISSRRSSIFV